MGYETRRAIHELVQAEDMGSWVINLDDLIDRFTDRRGTERPIFD
jgi:hypothetical protein